MYCTCHSVWPRVCFPGGSDGYVSACNAGDLGLIPESGRSPGEGNGNPIQYSCLDNPMDRGPCWATIHGSDTTERLTLAFIIISYLFIRLQVEFFIRKRPLHWERLRAGEGGDRGWDGWMASLIQWTWVWANSGSWWWTGRPGMLQSMGSQRVGHDWATELT